MNYDYVGLDADTTYFWYVSVQDDNGSSTQSKIFNFTIRVFFHSGLLSKLHPTKNEL